MEQRRLIGGDKMTAARQDAWTPDDDLILAEVTLRHIREGGTQLSAFEEVGEKIGRTAAACGFRWNSAVRKKYEAAIGIAKAQRQKRKQQQRKNGNVTLEPQVMTADTGTSLKLEVSSEEALSMEAVIRFLKQFKSNQYDASKQLSRIEAELTEIKSENARLKKENEELQSRVQHVQTEHQVVNEDYKALIQIMDRARKMAFLMNEGEQDYKPRFKMDANGNLERVDR
jgi:prespore-specific regulator